MRWFTIIGLVLDAIGALYLTAGLFVSKSEAIEIGVTRVAGETDEENVQLPAVVALLEQSRKAKIGTVLLAVGLCCS